LTRYLLDTNIISNLVKPIPSEPLLAWMVAQRDDDLHISAWTLAEIWRGILELPPGRKRQTLQDWASGPEGPEALFAGRVLPFDARAGLVWAELMAEGSAVGRPRSALDMIIAAVAAVHDCQIVTDNDKHFAGLDVINPMRVERQES
jgi:predicted nucleic acid-binding protein